MTGSLSAALFICVFVSDFWEIHSSRMGPEFLARRVEWGRRFWPRTHPERFANNRPMGMEVLDWLREQQLSSYVPIFLHHGIDTLLSASNLSRDKVVLLAEEYTEIYSLDHKQRWELNLWQAVNSLKRDPRARPMTERLEWFEDSAVEWHCFCETTTPNIFACQRPCPQQGQLVLHACSLTH